MSRMRLFLANAKKIRKYSLHLPRSETLRFRIGSFEPFHPRQKARIQETSFASLYFFNKKSYGNPIAYYDSRTCLLGSGGFRCCRISKRWLGCPSYDTIVLSNELENRTGTVVAESWLS